MCVSIVWYLEHRRFISKQKDVRGNIVTYIRLIFTCQKAVNSKIYQGMFVFMTDYFFPEFIRN